jgi:4-carboxymuconolactone decarboxylase
VDDLNRDHFVANLSWEELSKHYSERQCMDLVFTVGQYTQVSMILNSFGIQVEDGQTVDPDLKAL